MEKGKQGQDGHWRSGERNGEGLGEVTGQEWEDGPGIRRTVVLAFWREVIAVTKILGRT